MRIKKMMYYSIVFVMLYAASICYSHVELISDSLETETAYLTNVELSTSVGDSLLSLKNGYISVVHKDSLFVEINLDSIKLGNLANRKLLYVSNYDSLLKVSTIEYDVNGKTKFIEDIYFEPSDSQINMYVPLSNQTMYMAAGSDLGIDRDSGSGVVMHGINDKYSGAGLGNGNLDLFASYEGYLRFFGLGTILTQESGDTLRTYHSTDSGFIQSARRIHITSDGLGDGLAIETHRIVAKDSIFADSGIYDADGNSLLDGVDTVEYSWNSDKLDGYHYDDVYDSIMKDVGIEISLAGMAAYADVHHHDDTITVAIPTGDTYTKLPIFNRMGESLLHVPDTANDQIIAGRTGVNFVGFTASAYKSGAAVAVLARPAIFKNGIEQDNVHAEQYFSNSNIKNAIAGFNVLSLIEGDTIDLRMRTSSGSSTDWNFTYTALVVFSIANADSIIWSDSSKYAIYADLADSCLKALHADSSDNSNHAVTSDTALNTPDSVGKSNYANTVADHDHSIDSVNGLIDSLNNISLSLSGKEDTAHRALGVDGGVVFRGNGFNSKLNVSEFLRFTSSDFLGYMQYSGSIINFYAGASIDGYNSAALTWAYDGAPTHYRFRYDGNSLKYSHTDSTGAVDPNPWSVDTTLIEISRTGGLETYCTITSDDTITAKTLVATDGITADTALNTPDSVGKSNYANTVADHDHSIDSINGLIDSLESKVSGTGLSGYLSLWDGTGSQTNSAMYQYGTNLIIGGTSSTAKLDIRQNSSTSGALGLLVSKGYESSGNVFVLYNHGSSRSIEVRHNADDSGFVDDIMRMYNYNTRILTIDNNGNIGIRVADPTESIDATGGNVKCDTTKSMFVIVDSNLTVGKNVTADTGHMVIPFNSIVGINDTLLAKSDTGHEHDTLSSLVVGDVANNISLISSIGQSQIKVGIGGDNTTIDDNNGIRINGSATQWGRLSKTMGEHILWTLLDTPYVNNINPSDGSYPIYNYEWPQGAMASFVFVFPTSRETGTDFWFYIKWNDNGRGSGTVDSTVGWDIRLNYADDEEALQSANETFSILDTVVSTNYYSYKTEKYFIDGSTLHIGSEMYVTIERSSSDSWNSGVSVVNPILTSVNIVYEINKLGLNSADDL